MEEERFEITEKMANAIGNFIEDESKLVEKQIPILHEILSRTGSSTMKRESDQDVGFYRNIPGLKFIIKREDLLTYCHHIHNLALHNRKHSLRSKYTPHL